MRHTVAGALALTLLAAVAASRAAPSADGGEPSAQRTQRASQRSSAPLAAAASPARLDLTGKWLLRHTIASSARRDWRGLELLFRVDLVQRGSRIWGSAVKWRENGRDVPAAARSRLEIEGTMDGRDIVGRWVETLGARRSRGTFRWRYSLEEGWLIGTFDSSVASAEGESIAVAIG